MLLWAREQRHGLEEDICVVDSVTGSDRGRWQHVKGLDRGWERRCKGSGEDSMNAWRLQGGPDDGTNSREVTTAWALGKFW
jgi:hypothetical protein